MPYPAACRQRCLPASSPAGHLLGLPASPASPSSYPPARAAACPALAQALFAWHGWPATRRRSTAATATLSTSTSPASLTRALPWPSRRWYPLGAPPAHTHAANLASAGQGASQHQLSASPQACSARPRPCIMLSCLPLDVLRRLTQNVIDGFGVSGVEGLYRRVCEITLGVLRVHRGSILRWASCACVCLLSFVCVRWRGRWVRKK